MSFTFDLLSDYGFLEVKIYLDVSLHPHRLTIYIRDKESDTKLKGYIFKICT